MVKVKDNHRNGHQDQVYRVCRNAPQQTQKYTLTECPVIHPNRAMVKRMIDPFIDKRHTTYQA